MANDNKSNENFTQEIVLPSRGLLNPEIPDGKITQRCMMVSDQKHLLNAVNSGVSNPMYKIIQDTVVSPESFDISSLTAPDTLYMLVKLRALSYGNEYIFRARCPECGKKIDITVDLSNLQVSTLEDGFSDSLVTKLPHRGDTVYTRVLTNGDQESIDKELSTRRKKRPQDDSEYTYRIVRSIEKIVLKDGSELTHPVDIEVYVNSLTDLDAATILHARDSLVYGIIMSVETVCQECKSTIDVGVNLTQNFFRPSFK